MAKSPDIGEVEYLQKQFDYSLPPESQNVRMVCHQAGYVFKCFFLSFGFYFIFLKTCF